MYTHNLALTIFKNPILKLKPNIRANLRKLLHPVRLIKYLNYIKL